MKISLNEHVFTIEDEYTIVKALTMWLQYDLNNRMKYAEELFKFVTVHLCSNKLMLANKIIDTGNIDLDKIIKDININISVRVSIHNNADTLDLLNMYGNQHNFNNIQCNTHSLYKVSTDGIYDIQNNNALIKHEFGSVSNVIYTKSNNLYILCCSIGKMFKYNKHTNSITNCQYPSDYLCNERHPPTINEMCDGNLITIGGAYIDTEVDTDKVMIYNTSTDTWSAGPTLPYVVTNHATVVDNNNIYVISGCSSYGCNTNVIRYKYDVWESMASLEYGIQRHIAVKYGNIIYAISGRYYDDDDDDDDDDDMEDNDNDDDDDDDDMEDNDNDDDDDDDISNIESYNIQTNQWNTIQTDVFNGISKDDTVYDNNTHLFYKYKNRNIYCISLDNYTSKLKYSNIGLVNNITTKFILM